jgi:hypothetical protein
VEESLHLILVAGKQLGRNLNLVAVLVVALGSDLVHAVQVVGEVVVFYAERGEVFWVHWASGVVREALVALVRLVLVNREFALLGLREGKHRQVVKPVGFHFDICVASR